MLSTQSIKFNTPNPKPASQPAQPKKQEKSEEPSGNTEETKKLTNLVSKSDEVLYKVSATWPFDLFPDELVITLNEITLIRRIFFGSESISAIATDELSEVSEETIPFFTTLRLKPVGKDPVLIKFLPYKQGKEAGKILHGIASLNKANIDLTKLDPQEAKSKIKQLGDVGE